MSRRLSWRGGLCHARNLQHHTLPARIYANEGLCQILLFQSDEVCETSYADRKGKIPVAEGDCAAAAVGSREGNWLESAVEENVEGLAVAIRFEHSRYHD